MGNEITIVNYGATIAIAPITLAFANQLLMRFEGSELHAAFGIDFESAINTPGDELGCLRLSFDHSLTLPLNALNKLLGISLPVGVAVSKNVSISKNLFVLMVLECITEPENSYRLNLHVEPPLVLSCGKPRVTPGEGLAPTKVDSNE
ncbi:hypothetical protein L2W98_25330 [Citrobacter freundii]|uniref:hypothetical protein n=1 Tax=Citrobacter freundii TaxID=546 RepID=UPI00155E0BD9|nr:hypothetical protein [Citrobacter freundii]MDE9631740.1 hypothetical protein [Citrobacter freundii]MDE9731413.1 hypothetical protein [Citrobacter freundii]MDV1267955.1 hypothetical protein [Citrobacter freundii]MEB0407917.1 hypothetical protein [Citrobacter freundii]